MPELKNITLIGLGANLEKPLETLRQALKMVDETPGLSLLVSSPVYITEPRGGPDGQNWYHNAVAFFQCRLNPRQLLELLLKVEKDLGRQRLERWAPRIIDLDLLAFGRQVIDEPPDLIVPHPRMAERAFVLAPLAQAAPGWVHPSSGLTAVQMLKAIDRGGQGLKKTDFRL